MKLFIYLYSTGACKLFNDTKSPKEKEKIKKIIYFNKIILLP
jgi:hypothetical protein